MEYLLVCSSILVVWLLNFVKIALPDRQLSSLLLSLFLGSFFLVLTLRVGNLKNSVQSPFLHFPLLSTPWL